MKSSIAIAITTLTVLMAARAVANDLEVGDPVRNAQRLHDCIAENNAKKDGRSDDQIKQACIKAISDGTYKDPNISLDGMIKPQQ